MKLRDLLKMMEETAIKIECSTPQVCGGTPRDKYMKRLDNVSDLDITTGDKSVDFLSQELAAELSKKYNITRKSMDDGHSSIFIGPLKVDFSSNFNVPDVVVHLKKLGIENPTEIQKEMFSRDFTCNALLMSLDLKDITDPTGRGFKDIADKTIRTCLPPEITLTTNRNRVVRAIYLACKLGFDLDPSIIEFVKNNPDSIKLSTEKSMTEKLNEAFSKDAEKAAELLTSMGLWNSVPITDLMNPYYLKHVKETDMQPKKAYFQGGGGVNEPTPKKTKYPAEKKNVDQSRFKTPFFKNYDLYDNESGPGGGWNEMQNYKSIKEFLDAKRKHNKNKYKSDDSYVEPDGKITKSKKSKSRFLLLKTLVKYAIDFAIDEQIKSDPILSEQDSYSASTPIGGEFDRTLTLDDFEGKSINNLNHGRDYVENEFDGKYDPDSIEELVNMNKDLTDKHDFESPDETPGPDIFRSPYHDVTDNGVAQNWEFNQK